MTSYKIENFFGHLDNGQTVEAVRHGFNLLSLDDAIDIILAGMTRTDLVELGVAIEEKLSEKGGDA